MLAITVFVLAIIPPSLFVLLSEVRQEMRGEGGTALQLGQDGILLSKAKTRKKDAGMRESREIIDQIKNTGKKKKNRTSNLPMKIPVGLAYFLLLLPRQRQSWQVSPYLLPARQDLFVFHPSKHDITRSAAVPVDTLVEIGPGF